MRKKCVRGTKSVRTAVLAVAMVSALMAAPKAQSSDPTTQPRLTQDSLTYLGGFRLPSSSANGDSFEFGGRQLAFNPASNSLFIGSRSGRVAEVSIPGQVNSSNPAAMPFASYLQPFSDPTEGRLGEVGRDGVTLDGLLVHNNRLYGSASMYYDALNEQRVSHYSHSLQLNEPSFSGWSSVWQPVKTGYVSGAMAMIPTEWRDLLGGPAATGQCCIPIVTRTSWGPSAFAFDPVQLGGTTAPAVPLLYYTGENPALGNWDAQNSTYGSTTTMGGMAFIAGTRTVLYFGRNGMGPNCYGNGTSDPALAGQASPDGSHYCYDPTSTDKGSHAYPYRYQIWAYDLNDFAAVKAGTKKPWEVLPYGVWPLDLPTPELTMRLGGVGYDAANQLLYVSQMYADQDGYAMRPLVHVIRINAVPGATDPISLDPSPAPAPAPVPPTTTEPPSSVVMAISLAANRTAPQTTGTAITFSASVVGATSALQYKWLIFDGTNWSTASNWSSATSYTWTPTTANSNYRVGVWARSITNTKDEAEASVSVPFAIAAPAVAELRAVSFSSNKPAPQQAGTPITFTASTVGATAVEYRWLLHDGLAWSMASAWSAQNTFTWTPSVANPSARVGVWARRIGNTTDQAEVTWSTDYPVTAAPVSSTPEPAYVIKIDSLMMPPKPPAQAVPISEVILTTDVQSPQAPGTTIIARATTVGGSSTLQYRWLIHDGTQWQIMTDWTTSSSYAWTPTAANSGHFIGVWVRNAINTNGDAEATRSLPFVIR